MASARRGICLTLKTAAISSCSLPPPHTQHTFYSTGPSSSPSAVRTTLKLVGIISGVASFDRQTKAAYLAAAQAKLPGN